ncbi:MBL fold metallo-hydrolase [Youngiibacter multivorans]|uniref:Phosphoribosyl 1,2-cyclic phosphodiesterase n=1 Tax=Youngiibacter multivorans TaxID=937251 RepID=A0ABS4FZR0_9CLOT|nr:MBL fold metallo-hydrolase [Youngiibacter multivorans]MBP1917585.1 phosphoribosyl 1,2-cyclic phosphodiesterase [Youngiibacter multivorans]
MIFCSLYSGSSGNSIFTGSEKTKVLIDAGLTGKSIISALENIGENPAELKGILVTHEHVDHIKAIGILSRRFNIPVYANAKTWQAMQSCIGNVSESNIRVFDRSFIIGDLEVSTFRVPHDAAACVGYTISDGKKSVSVATDIGVFTEEIRLGVKDSDLILLESNHDIEMVKFGPYPYPLKRRILGELGHLSNVDSGLAALELLRSGKKKIVLGHLSGTNNVPELAYKTVENILIEGGLTLGADVDLSLASRIRPSSYSEV